MVVCTPCFKGDHAANPLESGEDPRAEVSEKVRVGVSVRVGPVEFKLNVKSIYTNAMTTDTRQLCLHSHTPQLSLVQNKVNTDR